MWVNIPEHFDSKSADVFLLHDTEAASAWWFKINSGQVLAIDHSSLNIPPLDVYIFPSIEEAIKRKEEMVKEGWNIERDDLE